MQIFFKYCPPRTPHRHDEKTMHCTQHHYSLLQQLTVLSCYDTPYTVTGFKNSIVCLHKASPCTLSCVHPIHFTYVNDTSVLEESKIGQYIH